MPIQGLIPQFLNQKDESTIQLVVPGGDPSGTPRVTLLSVEAATQHNFENEMRLLLVIKPLDLSSKFNPPKQLRWMHFSNNEMEFNLFLRSALEAYGIDNQARATITKFFDRFLVLCEQSAFCGGRFRRGPASTRVQLPGSEKKVMVNFTAIPYFLLQEAQSPPKPTAGRTKVHWVQPLVQSGYHLDSFRAREHQQAIRRLYSHITQIIHVPQLWLLTIGDKFIATCSPTPLYDSQGSSLIIRTIGRDPFPSMIRITTASGFVFFLEQSKCSVWFEFLYRVQSVMSAAREASIDTRNWVYKLETDGSLIEARHWRLLLQQHPDSELLPILASPSEPEPNPSANKLTIVTRYPLGVSEILKRWGERVLAHSQRRIRKGDDSRIPKRGEPSGHPYQNIDPYYRPPDSVLDTARSQHKREQAQSQGQNTSQSTPVGTLAKDEAKQEKQPVFKWTVGKPSVDKVSGEPSPTQRMKALLAYIHRDLLFLQGLRLSKLYNALPLETKSSVLKQIDTLRTKYHVNFYILDHIQDFVRYISDILEEFIDSNYDCVVKGKVWAAVYAVIQTFQYGFVNDALLQFQIEILALPLGPALRQIHSIRYGLAGVANPSIPRSLVEAFIEIVALLVNMASDASEFIANIDRLPKPTTTVEPSAPIPESAPASNLSQIELSNSDATESDGERNSDRGSDDMPHHQSHAAFPYSPDSAIDRLFIQLAQAQDECCATFCSDKEVPGSPGLGTIVALILESVLRGHSICKEMPVLDLGEIYATYTTSLQLKARNRPSKNLLLDINLLREELGTIIMNINLQLNLITDLRTDSSGNRPDDDDDLYMDETDFLEFEMLYSSMFGDSVLIDPSARAVLQDIHTDLREQKEVFAELIKRADILERQIVQRVDIIQEDHGKAILVFTIVSTIFLPLSFVATYLGMNTADIRDMDLNQSLFWQVAVPVTVVVVVLVLVGAYNAGRILRFISKGEI